MVKTQKTRSNHREVEVLDALRRLGGSARNANLAELLGVSEETIRRTTKSLAKADLVRRVHGGSYLPDRGTGSGVFERLRKRRDEKGRIGEATAALIADGTCVFLDVGSTTTFVAQALSARRDLTVVTNSLNAAQALADHPGHRVFLAGGELRHAEWGVFGSDTADYVRGFNIDTAVISVDGIDAIGGFLLKGREELALARAVVASARETIVVADHKKFGVSAPHVICAPTAIATLVSDRAPGVDLARRLAEWQVRVVDAGEGTTAGTDKGNHP